ncbi:hypothetical protein SAMN04489806_2756 [Paramicrobacterium humi]|uniref:Uncharacterized protein n=1 Tax=Paramicrobacterium humi TaxID=640635 RepID=A0A1H4Q9U8_9MICO|nr:hypothetical protein [Microbacterium humi]SEC16404.1 hypothetical protein SAMN04489806_2756 [Microbacterium humi]
MTSFPDEQPLSRRARREKLRAEHPQDDAPRTERDPDPEPADTSTPAVPADEAAVDDSAPAPDRPLTRREMRARRQDTGSLPLVPDEPVVAEEAEPAAPADQTSSEAPALTPAEIAPEKSTEPAEAREAIAPAPTTAFTPPSPPSQDAATEALIAPGRATQRDSADSPQLSPAFGAGLKRDRPHESAPPGFDALIAPEARTSEALTTSSVLILPNIPHPNSHHTVSTTGEILVTGSVDLPTSGGAAETSNGIDRTDIDSGLDKHGNAPATAGTPVSATKAVSTHTATRDVITPPTKSANSRLLMILAITAGVLCVAVIGVVIVGLMTGAF